MELIYVGKELGLCGDKLMTTPSKIQLLKARKAKNKAKKRKEEVSKKISREQKILGSILVAGIFLPPVISFFNATQIDTPQKINPKLPKAAKPSLPLTFENSTLLSSERFNKQESLNVTAYNNPTLLHNYKHFCKNPGYKTVNNPTIRVDLLPFDKPVTEQTELSLGESSSYSFYPASCAFSDKATQCSLEMKIRKQFWEAYSNELRLGDLKECEKKMGLKMIEDFMQEFNARIGFDNTITHSDLHQKFKLCRGAAQILDCQEGACGDFSGFSAIRLLAEMKKSSPQISHVLITKYFAQDVHQFLVLNSGLASMQVTGRKNVGKVLNTMKGYICDPWNMGYFKSVRKNKVRMYAGKFLDKVQIQTIAWDYDWSSYSMMEQILFEKMNEKLNNIIIKIANLFDVQNSYKAIKS